MRTVGVLIFPEFQLLDAAGPIAALDIAGRLHVPSHYRLKTIAREAGPVASSSGVALHAEVFRNDETLDTLLIAGGWGTRQAMHCPDTLAFIRDSAKRARRVASVCSGALMLAAAGLLDGRRATTHWRVAPQLARRVPPATGEPGPGF